MNLYRSFDFRSIGASHIKKGTVCQDFSGSVETDSYKLAVISDGHGGEDYFRSDRGSRFAVEAFCRCVEDAFAVSSPSDEELSDGSFLQNKAKNFSDALNACKTDKQIEEQMRWFMRSIVTRWNILVDEDLADDPFKAEEMAEVCDKTKARYEKGERVQSAYGAPLIGAVVTEDFWFGVHIGDGKCIAFDMSGIDTEPIPWDEQCFLNVTTSICDANASSEMRYFFSRELPAAVFVGSDGIGDSFKNERHLHNFYRVVLSSFATETEEKAMQGLADYLPNLSAQGSADDMSVGCIINIEHIKTLLRTVQARIDFVNLKSTPTNLLTIISNKDVVDILYEFLKTKIEILDMSELTDAMKEFAATEEYATLTALVNDVQNEIKRNRNHNQIEMVKLDELLQRLFQNLDITNLADINEELRAILDEIRRINEENERISARYDGNYAFVKSYTDAIEIHPEHNKNDVADVIDIVYAAVKEIKTANILILQGRDNFVSSVSNKTITKLIKAKLYVKLALKEWYDELLGEIYTNMKIF